MQARIVVCLVVAAVANTFSAYAQSQSPDVLNPGLWSVTVQTKAPIVGPPITQTTCVLKAETVAKPQAPKSRKTDDCQVVTDAGAANETAYTVRCANKKVTTTAR